MTRHHSIRKWKLCRIIQPPGRSLPVFTYKTRYPPKRKNQYGLSLQPNILKSNPQVGQQKTKSTSTVGKRKGKQPPSPVSTTPIVSCSAEQPPTYPQLCYVPQIPHVDYQEGCNLSPPTPLQQPPYSQNSHTLGVLLESPSHGPTCFVDLIARGLQRIRTRL